MENQSISELDDELVTLRTIHQADQHTIQALVDLIRRMHEPMAKHKRNTISDELILHVATEVFNLTGIPLVSTQAIHVPSGEIVTITEVNGPKVSAMNSIKTVEVRSADKSDFKPIG